VTDKPTHSTSMVLRASIVSESEVSITVLCLLCAQSYTVVWFNNCSKSTSVIKIAAGKIGLCCMPQLSTEIEVLITLLCQLCSTHYTSVWIKNCLKSPSVIKVATMKNTDDFCYAKEAIMCNQCFSLPAKMNGTQRRTLVSPWRIHWMHCGMPKGTSQDEATSDSEKIKPVALAVIELC